MVMHIKLISALLAGFAASNGAAILGGMYLDYRFKIVEKVEPYVIKALSLLKRV